ncbi:MAG: hypothetical protein LC792_29860, partial [Actinobacteria bacterium]|nr:hypothetical protein [Actinomycetota bacterium]
FYGLPGVLGRMVSEAKLAVIYDETIDERMAFPSVDEAVRMAFLGGPLAGLYTKRVDDQQERDTRHLLREHLSGLAEASGSGVLLPAEIRIVVAEKNPDRQTPGGRTGRAGHLPGSPPGR